MTPAPQPLRSFRGQPLTHGAAEDIFIGNLAETVHNNGGQSFSWRVAAGKNPGTHITRSHKFPKGLPCVLHLAPCLHVRYNFWAMSVMTCRTVHA
jgi:hypothetical protein